MADMYRSQASEGVSYTATSLTKSDSTVYDPPLRWVDVIDGGTVTIVDQRGATKALPSVPAGYSIKCGVQKIMSTGTGASVFIGYP